MKKITPFITGFLAGILNGLFGAGGGIASVFLLTKSGFDQKKAQATSIVLILPLSIVSGFFYWFKGSFQLTDALVFIPGGLAGALAGALLLKKFSDNLLRRIFGGFIIWAALRILF